MADATHIEWTDATWNPVTGCSVVSPGCTNCYAMKLAGTRLKHTPSRSGLTIDSKAGPVWNGEVRLNEQWLDQPRRWARPRKIFVCAHGDLFHESVPDAWIDQVFARMGLAPRHTFQVLTKRSARMRAYLSDDAAPRRIGAVMEAISGEEDEGWWAPESDGKVGWLSAALPLPNVWLGVSVEDQVRAEQRIPDLLETPASVRFVSYEPALGYVDFRTICTGHYFIDALGGLKYHDAPEDGPPGATQACESIDQIIMGGESGPDARPMHPSWARWTRRDCADSRTAFFFKQWGAWAPGENVERQRGTVKTATLFNDTWEYDQENLASTDGTVDDEPDLYCVGKKAAGRLLDGEHHDAMPAVCDDD